MNTQRIRELMIEKGGGIQKLSVDDIRQLELFMGNADLKQYLLECLPENTFRASGIDIWDKEQIIGYKGLDSSCSLIYEYGFMPLGDNGGADIICVDAETGDVYFASHQCFFEDEIEAVTDKGRSIMLYEYNPENIRLGMNAKLSTNLERFLVDLLEDKLEDYLDDVRQGNRRDTLY